MDNLARPDPVPPEIRRVWQQLDALGPTYVVGGAVRDIVQGAAPCDWDLATAVRPDALLAWAERTGVPARPTGIRYGTVTLEPTDGPPLQVTTFRRDGRYGDGRHPDRVDFSDRVEEDLGRRDFTVNAMALALDGTLIDPFDGLSDLRAGRLRAVGPARDRLQEDPLRVLRAMRFLGYDAVGTLTDELADAVQAVAPALGRVSRERVGDELRRMLSVASPGRAWAAASALGVLSQVWPEWAAVRGFEQHRREQEWPLDGHLLAVADAAPTAALRLTGLLHDVGKPVQFRVGPDGQGRFPEHAQVGALMARDMLRRFGWDRETIRTTAEVIRWHSFSWDAADTPSLRRVVRELGFDAVEALLTFRQMDVRGRGRGQSWVGEAEARARVEALRTDGSAVPLIIRGDDVMAWTGMPPGPDVGRLLARAQDWVDADPARNEREALRRFVTARASHGGVEAERPR